MVVMFYLQQRVRKAAAATELLSEGNQIQSLEE